MKYEFSKELVDVIVANLLEQPAKLSYNILEAIKYEVAKANVPKAEAEEVKAE